MRADGHVSLPSHFYRLPHRVGIAGVEATGDIRRSYERQEFVVVSRAFTEIGVEIDNKAHLKCSSNPRRNCSMFRSRSRSSACASRIETSANRTRSPGRN